MMKEQTPRQDSNMIPRRKIKAMVLEKTTPRNLPSKMNRRLKRQGNVGNNITAAGRLLILILLSTIPLIALWHHYSGILFKPPPTRVLKTNNLKMTSANPIDTQQNVQIIANNSQQQQQPVLDSGWDDFAQNLYQNKVQELEKNAKLTVTLPGRGRSNEPVVVSYSTWWWTAFPPPGSSSSSSNTKGQWERETFLIFDKYINADTIVVDFGMWIGPTILYNARIAKHVYGIDADPVSFATAQRNVQLNSDKDWSRRITLESACVSAPDDVGSKMMKSHESGDSMSGIANHISNTVVMQWKVQCYTLPDIFQKWGLSLDSSSKFVDPIFIKIDIESYECHLIPSLYDWLVGADDVMLPTIYVSFHNQIAPCTEEEWSGVLKVMKLYRTVTTGSGRDLGIQPNTTNEEFSKIRRTAGAVGPTFVLTNQGNEATPLASKK